MIFKFKSKLRGSTHSDGGMPEKMADDRYEEGDEGIMFYLRDDMGNAPPPPSVMPIRLPSYRRRVVPVETSSTSSSDAGDDTADSDTPIWEPTALVPTVCEDIILISDQNRGSSSTNQSSVISWEEDEQCEVTNKSGVVSDSDKACGGGTTAADDDDDAYMRIMGMCESPATGPRQPATTLQTTMSGHHCEDADKGASSPDHDDDATPIRSPYFADETVLEGSDAIAVMGQESSAYETESRLPEMEHCQQGPPTVRTRGGWECQQRGRINGNARVGPGNGGGSVNVDDDDDDDDDDVDIDDDDDDEVSERAVGGRGRELGRIECSPSRQAGEVWCFGCMWGARGYRPVDSEKVKILVSEFNEHLLSGMSTVANVAIHTSYLYETMIRQPSLDMGHWLPEWPPWSVERHIRNMREPQVRLALTLERIIAVMDKTSKHVVLRDQRTGAEGLNLRAGRLFLATVKEWRELERVDPSSCFGFNIGFRSDPSRYATLVHPSRIAVDGRGASNGVGIGQPAYPGAPVASLPGQRGMRTSAHSRSGADTGELRLQDNGEELVRRTQRNVG